MADGLRTVEYWILKNMSYCWNLSWTPNTLRSHQKWNYPSAYSFLLLLPTNFMLGSSFPSFTQMCSYHSMPPTLRFWHHGRRILWGYHHPLAGSKRTSTTWLVSAANIIRRLRREVPQFSRPPLGATVSTMFFRKCMCLPFANLWIHLLYLITRLLPIPWGNGK